MGSNYITYNLKLNSTLGFKITLEYTNNFPKKRYSGEGKNKMSDHYKLFRPNSIRPRLLPTISISPKSFCNIIGHPLTAIWTVLIYTNPSQIASIRLKSNQSATDSPKLFLSAIINRYILKSYTESIPYTLINLFITEIVKIIN